MFEYILFDFDGTIFDTVEGITKSVRYAINKFGKDAELEDLRCFAGPPLVDMFMSRFGLSKDEAVQAVAYYRERYKPTGIYESRPFPGVKELLEGLIKLGKPLAIATSKPQVMAEELLSRSGLIEYFDLICGALDDKNNAKWQIVTRVLENFGAKPEQAVLVGDTKYDVIGAHQCHVKCIGVEYGYAAAGELEESGADYIVKDTEELLKLLSE
ncbi:MAG: HAD hydrolase-like protein [Oscillospiraceae bacterium]|nr:HAD hydrolase-like protein [Oscillospiraceae bacterium]